jgi:hypothetical protein
LKKYTAMPTASPGDSMVPSNARTAWAAAKISGFPQRGSRLADSVLKEGFLDESRRGLRVLRALLVDGQLRTFWLALGKFDRQGSHP